MATYTIDTAHSMAEFSVRHMMISTVRGVFEDLSGTLEFDLANPEASRIEAVIKTGTINTRQPDRDNHLRSADFFDADNHPDMTFTSTKIEVTGESTGQVMGDLTIRGKTREVTFDVTYFGEIANSPFGDKRVGFAGTTSINREDWNLNWNQALEAGGWLVSKEVTINIELQAATQPVTA